MKIRQWFAIACGVALIAGATGASGQAGGDAAATDLDGLIKVKSNRLDQVYLRPSADLRRYTKAMLSPTQVTFAKNWLTELNSRNSRIAVLQGTTVADADRIAGDVRSGLRNAFTETFRRAGYEVVSAPGPDVLGLSVRVFDLYINAPKTVTQALPSRVYTYDAGHATLALEVRDSATGTLLGRVVDYRTAGYRGGPRSMRITTTASNQFDFESMFDVWATSCIDELKAQSPLAVNVPAQNKY
jgi:uncharacterized protein DUF3313